MVASYESDTVTNELYAHDLSNPSRGLGPNSQLDDLSEPQQTLGDDRFSSKETNLQSQYSVSESVNSLKVDGSKSAQKSTSSEASDRSVRSQETSSFYSADPESYVSRPRNISNRSNSSVQQRQISSKELSNSRKTSNLGSHNQAEKLKDRPSCKRSHRYQRAIKKR